MVKKRKRPLYSRLLKWAAGFFFSALVLSAIFLVVFVQSLPDVSVYVKKNPQATALMKQRVREARIKKKNLEIRQSWVRFAEIPELLRKAVRISEDITFYHHRGYDSSEIKTAVKDYLLEGKRLRGASTITQQLAKNLFLSNKRSFLRKLKEFAIARRLEKNLSKKRIFELYLNVIEFGPGVFGVEAAANVFFSKSVAGLTLPEILKLVAVIPKPLRVSPLSASRYLKWRAAFIMDKLRKLNYIDEKSYAENLKFFTP